MSDKIHIATWMRNAAVEFGNLDIDDFQDQALTDSEGDEDKANDLMLERMATIIAKHAPKPFPVGFPEPDDGGDSTIRYRNYRGEVATRRIIPTRIYWGSNEWHPEPQWLIEAHDLEKEAVRTFAVSGLLPPEE